ncbi:hypothetical protein [Haladaptatus sp. DJG-WS-42]|uniref:hypothetical protein n=1 Tax=Haladaptatus sp. DJG-WS-42 TaxID=3120516 RepID=UPI0030D371C2
MKSGAGDDPFADIFEEETAPQDADSATEGGDSTGEPAGVDASGNGSAQSTAETSDAAEIPWIFRRDKVKSDRDKVHQLFVKPETDRSYRRFESDLEEAMDTDLSRLDVREAAYLVGMQHPEMVISLLESWGYNYFD